MISGSPAPTFNGILCPSLEPDPEEIAALADSEDWNVPWSITVRGTPGSRISAVAARYGLTEAERQPLMVRTAEQGVPAEPAIDSLRVRSVAADEMGLLAATLADAFEAPYAVFRVLADPAYGKVDEITFYLAELDGVPVATGMLAVIGDFASLGNIAVLPRCRRRGYGRAVTVEMIRAGFAAGAGSSFLYASEMGKPLYESLGFRTAEYQTVFMAPSS
jgi:N-acetylglutamate synthase